MRAHQFIVERDGKITKRQQDSTKGLNVFADSERWNSDYVLNRVMMAVASADGVNPVDIDSKSWVGKYKTAHPYTPIEQEMLKAAYKAAGANYKDLNHGDLESKELESTNTNSPIKSFKGYKKK